MSEKMPVDKKILVSKSISKKFDERLILDNINFEMNSGEILGLLGPSGIGKTTLLNILVGTEKQTQGEIINFHNSKIGYVFQEDRLFEWLSLFENVKIVSENIDEKIIWENLSLVGLKDYYNYFPKELSGGMRQRGSIARALTFAANILLFDEPFKSLDVKLRFELLDLMKKLKKEKNISILFVTHDIEEALYACDRILIMKGQPAKISKEINISNSRIDHKLSIEKEVELKREILSSLYD